MYIQQERFCGLYVLCTWCDVERICWCVFCVINIWVDDWELIEVQLVICQAAIAECRNWEVTHQICCRFAINHEWHRFLPAVWLVIVNKAAHVDQLTPVCKCCTYTVIGPCNFAVCQLDVEIIAICAWVDVVKPAASCPKILWTDCVTLTTRVDDGLAVWKLFGPCFWLA